VQYRPIGRLELFWEHPDAIFVIDPEGNYCDVNPAFTTVSGYNYEEALRLSFHKLVCTEDLETTLYHFNQCMLGVVQRYESSATCKDGKKLYFDVTNIPVLDDSQIIGVYGISKDITLTKQLAAQKDKYEALYQLISAAA
jgi:PAS domain S-box-containing protein